MVNLSGASANEYLKKQGGYESIIESVKRARRDQSPPQDFAETRKLLASDGAAQEIFGRAVAVSGSTDAPVPGAFVP